MLMTFSVVVEGGFVEERRADGVGCVDNAAARRVTEGVTDRGNVVTAPLAGAEGFASPARDVVSEDGELGGEVMINADDLFTQVRRGVVAADKFGGARQGRGEDARL